MTDLVRVLQERAAHAQPAEHVVTEDGWWLRHAPGCAWWVGTVLPHRAHADLIRRVVRAEEFYAGLGARARFQITPGVCPDDLDTVLAARGYRRSSRMSLQVTPVDRVPAAPGVVLLDPAPTDAWFAVRRAVHGVSAGDPGEGSRDSSEHGERRLLARVTRPSAFASVLRGDDVVAVGRAVADGGWAGVFSMATVPAARGLGAARAVLAALAGWAATRGADRLYLQVERDNTAACRLYAGAGFAQVTGYHYRAES